MTELKPWPKHPRETYPPQFNALSDTWKAALMDYERLRADAAMERLKLAVYELQHAVRVIDTLSGNSAQSLPHRLMLEAVGDLPE